MTFEKLLRMYRFEEALALYDAYYERMADLGEKRAHLGDALPIAWVPLIFHCTYFDNLKGILNDGKLRPSEEKSYVALTELPVTELTRFRSLRPKPFEIAIGFPRALLESKGLYQPAYLKHATQEVKDKFKDAPSGYVELSDDLGALHEVRIPGPLPIDDAVWVLSAKRNEDTRKLDLPELKPLRDLGVAVSYWHPSHQQGMIREPVFRRVKRNEEGHLVSLESVGKHYLPEMDNYVEREINPPAGKSFNLRFPKELRPDTLADGWEGPFSKYEMAAFCYEELKKKFPGRIGEVQPRIVME
ncbi:hypothetical protein [Planctopirus hydrillae]|uniref:Uncharacterized protein n=1 Tax=Planctopirus hydrillae TaxID=1841610 RepID=A0A1C3ENZ2_9PLAN|nr:hypothetical protein [Planctopirus hydrillae]ODA34954.1 hypothetical protein A6X21_04770 [Planctopirus hydrillae]